MVIHRTLAGLAILAVAATCLASDLKARRAYEPGGQPTMVRTGEGMRSKLMSAEGGAGGFSFSTRSMYSVSLYLDETGARQALAPFKGRSIDELRKESGIHRAVVDGDFPKMLVISFPYQRTAREMREDLAEVIGRGFPFRTESGKLIGYFRTDLNSGDEAIIRFAPDRVMVTIAGEAMPDIPGRDFARALLGVWVDKDRMSGAPRGLLSEASPLLQ